MAVLSFSNADMRQCKGLGGRSSTPRDSRGGGFGQWEVCVWGLVPYKPCQIRLYRSTGSLEINYVWKPWLIMLHKSVWSRNMVQGLVYKVLGQYKRCCRISIRHVRSRRQERTACLPRDQARRAVSTSLAGIESSFYKILETQRRHGGSSCPPRHSDERVGLRSKSIFS